MKTQTVHGIPCHLKKRSVRTVFNSVLDQIKQKCPKDYRRLLNIVREVQPWEGDQDGTMGEWKSDSFDPYHMEEDAPGVILVNEKITQPHDGQVALIAHELGHAATRSGDMERRGNCPYDEWASEMSADWYAYKWGFGRLIRKHSEIRDWRHHGPLPGHTFEIDRGGKTYNYRITRNFVVHFEKTTAAKRDLAALKTELFK